VNLDREGLWLCSLLGNELHTVCGIVTYVVMISFIFSAKGEGSNEMSSNAKCTDGFKLPSTERGKLFIELT